MFKTLDDFVGTNSFILMIMGGNMNGIVKTIIHVIIEFMEEWLLEDGLQAKKLI